MMKPIEVIGPSPGAGGTSVVHGGVKLNQDIREPTRADSGAKVPKPDSVDLPDQGGEALSTFAALNAGKERINQLAGEVRGLGEAQSLVKRVQASLELVVKSFPPFPPGSLEREQFLNSVAGIRSIIEQLTFPPEQKQQIAEVMSLPAFTNSSASASDLTTGRQGLDKVNADLADAQIALKAEASFHGGNQQEDNYYVEQSQGVGLALMRQHASILKDSRQILGVLN